MRKDIGNGFVRIVDTMGNDTTVVNAARVSFGKSISEIRDQDKSLLKFLVNHGHLSPFRHCQVQFHIKAPEFVARQWYKHCIGAEYTFKDHAWNEISGRYVEYDLVSWIPDILRKAAENKKQGSSLEPIDNHDEILRQFKCKIDKDFEFYKELLRAGVCNEQARTVLPLTFYTEWYWTASLQAIAHFAILRKGTDAQLEIQKYAYIISDFMHALFPDSWAAIFAE